MEHKRTRRRSLHHLIARALPISRSKSHLLKEITNTPPNGRIILKELRRHRQYDLSRNAPLELQDLKREYLPPTCSNIACRYIGAISCLFTFSHPCLHPQRSGDAFSRKVTLASPSTSRTSGPAILLLQISMHVHDANADAGLLIWHEPRILSPHR